LEGAPGVHLLKAEQTVKLGQVVQGLVRFQVPGMTGLSPHPWTSSYIGA